MLEDLPEDQQTLLRERLGEDRLERLAVEATSVTSFYNLCIRQMGSLSEPPKVQRIPTPMSAWQEVYGKRREPEPEFSHPKIAEVVKYMGGWSRMWLDFSKKKEEKARNTWVMQYKDAIGG